MGSIAVAVADDAVAACAFAASPHGPWTSSTSASLGVVNAPRGGTKEVLLVMSWAPIVGRATGPVLPRALLCALSRWQRSSPSATSSLWLSFVLFRAVRGVLPPEPCPWRCLYTRLGPRLRVSCLQFSTHRRRHRQDVSTSHRLRLPVGSAATNDFMKKFHVSDG